MLVPCGGDFLHSNMKSFTDRTSFIIRNHLESYVIGDDLDDALFYVQLHIK
jgi:hypothetical protein